MSNDRVAGAIDLDLATPIPDGQPGSVLDGRYRVESRIGSGGMADVVRAHDEVLGRDVAIKLFRPALGPDESAMGPLRQDRELQALAGLNHPNLITLYDGSSGRGTGPAYLVMELVDGPNLAERIAQGPIPEPDVRLIGIEIADALSYVHARNMVHRDVKPANILLGASGDHNGMRAQLSDFGIVRIVGTERLTSVNMAVGSASFLAPEQALGQEVGPPADVYALGLVLLEALTLTRAFDGPPLEAMSTRLHRGPEIPEGLVHPWGPLLTAMTALDPASRPTAVDVRNTLRGAPMAAVVAPLLVADSETRELAAAALPVPGRVDRPGRLRALPVLVASVMLGILGIAIAGLMGSSSTSGTPKTPPPNLVRHTSAHTKAAGSAAPVHRQLSHQPSHSASTTAASTPPPSSSSRPAPSSATSQPPTSAPPSTPATSQGVVTTPPPTPTATATPLGGPTTPAA